MKQTIVTKINMNQIFLRLKTPFAITRVIVYDNKTRQVLTIDCCKPVEFCSHEPVYKTNLCIQAVQAQIGTYFGDSLMGERQTLLHVVLC